MNYVNKHELSLINEIRMLWMQHSEWTGAAINSIVLLAPNEEAIINRLLRNPKDFSLMLSRFYGDNIGFKFSNLLTEHLELAAELIKVIMGNELDKAEIIRKRWYTNAEEISHLLSSINPYWSFKAWRDMFFVHLKLAEKIAIELINEEYEKSIITYDEFEMEVMMMAQLMYVGLLRQFSC